MTHEECEELFAHQNDPDEWSDEEVPIEVRPRGQRRMPKIEDTDKPIICPLCHGEGKTTGKVVYALLDGLRGKMFTFYNDAIINISHTMMKRLWRAKELSE